MFLSKIIALGRARGPDSRVTSDFECEDATRLGPPGLSETYAYSRVFMGPEDAK